MNHLVSGLVAAIAASVATGGFYMLGILGGNGWWLWPLLWSFAFIWHEMRSSVRIAR
jgi:hypothetical protein